MSVTEVAGNDQTLALYPEKAAVPPTSLSLEPVLMQLVQHFAKYALPGSVPYAVAHRFEQIKRLKNFEKSPMPPLEALQIALYIEDTLKKQPLIAGRVLKMRETGLPRTLQVGAKGDIVYVIAKRS